MEKVFITGAKGFIGKYVVSLLEKNYELYLLNENIFDTDFDKLMQLLHPEYLIHLAWITGPGYLDSFNNAKFVQKGIEMYEAFYKYGGRRAVYVGTEQEYKRHNRPLKETDLIEPVSFYAECKADLGKILVQSSRISGNGFIWGRLFFIYGAGEKPKRLMPSIINSLLDDQNVTCSCESYIRDYIYVEDVASAIITCLLSDYTGYVNIGGGRNTTIGEIAGMAKKIIGGTGNVNFRTHEECGQFPQIQADISLLKSLGWKQKYTLEDGIRTEISVLRHQREIPEE